jgi:hypothetical protein
MRIVIDTSLLWYKLKNFWNYKILRKPVPPLDMEKILEVIIIQGIGLAVAREITKVLAEKKTSPENKPIIKSEIKGNKKSDV